jgi:uncharacterized protein DUF3137
MKTTEDFREFYEAELCPVLRRFEWWRIGVIAFDVLLAVLGVVATIGTLHLFTGCGGMWWLLAVFIISASFWALCFAGRSMLRWFVRAFKARVIRRLVAFIAPGLNYARVGHIPESVFCDGRLFSGEAGHCSGTDCVSGKIGDTAIQFSVMHVLKKGKAPRGDAYDERAAVFWGLYVVADFNKEFRAVTVAVPDNAERLFGRFGRFIQRLDIRRPGRLIKLEDPEFEKQFAVYAEDEVEARYILSPALMERITALARKADRPVYLSFAHSSLHVAIPTKWQEKALEPRLATSVASFDALYGHFSLLQLALGIVEDLDLNTRIWSKE